MVRKDPRGSLTASARSWSRSAARASSRKLLLAILAAVLVRRRKLGDEPRSQLLRFLGACCSSSAYIRGMAKTTERSERGSSSVKKAAQFKPLSSYRCRKSLGVCGKSQLLMLSSELLDTFFAVYCRLVALSAKLIL